LVRGDELVYDGLLDTLSQYPGKYLQVRSFDRLNLINKEGFR